jgi:hypothetical protein
LGSSTKLVTLEIVGRTFSVTVSSELTWGVTDITKPTGTVCRVVVNDVVASVSPCVVSASVVK